MAPFVFAKFAVGQIVHHRMFDYRGVVIDVDPAFRGSEQWYEQVALSRPPKDEPWYHVLRDGTGYRTYVAERNLEVDESLAPIQHPEVEDYFVDLGDDGYVSRQRGN